ncbi:MAG: multicopper oxidase domain-containing protein [Stigonema ocellatum SAG 48.90 = DSM 106950]|nr:multicopper oxidase domain-containing protein [Stigonema ocellatum SAG 48.90 = DSM 106950]
MKPKIMRKRQFLFLISVVVQLNILLYFGMPLITNALITTTNSLLDPTTQPKFLNSLPSPVKIDATKGGKFNVEISQSEQWLGLYSSAGADGVYGTGDDVRLNTTVWGYSSQGQTGASNFAPTFVAQKDVPIEVLWSNKLPQNGHLLPVDTSIITESLQKALQQGYVPTVTHLHGGHTESASDGLPDAWFTQNFSATGPDWVKSNYSYANDQQAATLWYHDHTSSITRLNVYAGLAGFYFLRDNNENNLIDNGVLPSGFYEREIAIQDKQFTTNGQLFYPSQPSGTGAPNPSVQPEFFGNFILVNGIAWPKLEVEPRKYRFRLLNASDSRFYKLKYDDSKEKFYQIGTEQGFLEKPVVLDELVLSPGERADIIVDFTGDSGKEFILKNFDAQADANTTGQIIKILVNQPLANFPNATIDTDERDGLTTQLRPDKISLSTQTGATRKLVLFETKDRYGRKKSLLGTLADGSLLYDDPITEKPTLGTTEVWEIYNATDKAHPIHLHLVSFLVLNRQPFAGGMIPVVNNPGAGGTKQYLQSVSLIGTSVALALSDRGWKDTVIVQPGEVTRISATFDKQGKYVWHCHMLEHEDYEMMRPYIVN